MSFIYRHVTVQRVIDGDTVVMAVDMGNKITWNEHFRLMGIDTPERGQPGHEEAASRLSQLISGGLSRIETFKPDKYGRWLADLYVPVTGGELHINQALVSEGLAKPYNGGSRRADEAKA